MTVFEQWWNSFTSDPSHKLLDTYSTRVSWDAMLSRTVKLIEEKAAGQEHFAGPEYTQNTDADCRAFQHAAAILRMVVTELKK